MKERRNIEERMKENLKRKRERKGGWKEIVK
jgi:hypothetical protein